MNSLIGAGGSVLGIPGLFGGGGHGGEDPNSSTTNTTIPRTDLNPETGPPIINHNTVDTQPYPSDQLSGYARFNNGTDDGNYY
jgi:hypothetical protein